MALLWFELGQLKFKASMMTTARHHGTCSFYFTRKKHIFVTNKLWILGNVMHRVAPVDRCSDHIKVRRDKEKKIFLRMSKTKNYFAQKVLNWAERFFKC